ncbi:hypothetical protein [Fictibacillus barbaricus]|uniref:Uncharacterized protein n=2 Tax=Fictibacillus barbaricus TaxID=182136 RepID=A0ABS2Z7Y4_9BACL|nr:hypothetical protein [Fictibacillus barbaricus]MBN3544195.1 hypothetical protein [Fictibacillus barbaricus]GGB69699.1 hypothetical protein GCM10007199_39910 [Fictibacillus barbaricus]
MYLIKGTSWAGNDFLDAARNNKVLICQTNKEASNKESKFKELPFEVAKALLIQASKNYVRFISLTFLLRNYFIKFIKQISIIVSIKKAYF